MSSESRSVSVHVSVSESTVNSETSSSSGSSATSPREAVGTSRDPTASVSQSSAIPEEVGDSDDVPIFQKYSEMMQQKPWLGIASNLKMTPVAIKRKYYIPADYDIKIPRSFDRMHQPPEGYCALSILHLDAGLRFPLPREVNDILIRLGLCPMQLSPNSISHILMFIIVMKYLDLPSSFDNFWSLYNITSSKRSGETGWYYLTARKDCRFLDDLRSNVGPWRDRYFFIRPPPGQSWDFHLGWRETKPNPETFGEGFESDLINHITLFWYRPKVLLQEKVLKLAGLSPAPIPIKSSLETEVMLARLANKARAKKGTLPPSVDRELKEAAAAAKAKPKTRAATPTPSPRATASEPQSTPTTTRDRTPDEQVEVVEISEEPSLKRKRGKESIPRPEPTQLTESQSDPSSRSTKQGRLEAKLAADRVAEPENKRKLAALEESWQKMRDERPASARRAEMSGEKWLPDWNISKNSSVLRTFAGQDSWEVYKAACLERDQVILAQTSLASLEEHFAHNIAQAMAFAHHITLQGSMWRHDKIQIEGKAVEMERKILELQTVVESLRAEKGELVSKLGISERELEETKRTAHTDRVAAFESGREEGLAEGRDRGMAEGKASFLQSQDFQGMMKEARLNGARDFLRSQTFRAAVENQATELMIEGFEKCQGQIQKLNGLAEGFDLEQLDISLDRNLEPYPTGPEPTDAFPEFLPLMDVFLLHFLFHYAHGTKLLFCNFLVHLTITGGIPPVIL
ncbi:UNVERIFIED_CONTAM: hypothetical protein Sindi_2468300 [Sesamum indicum]